MNEAASRLAACSRCGCPLAGNESYCSNCGRRLEGRGPVFRRLAVAIVLVALAAAGTCVASRSHRRVAGRAFPLAAIRGSPGGSPERAAARPTETAAVFLAKAPGIQWP